VIYQSSKSQNPGPKICENSNTKKAAKSETTITTTTEGSCLSSGGSSEISSAGSRRRGKNSGEEGERKKRGGGVGVGMDQSQGDELKRRSGVGSKHIRRRAEAIMRLLSGGGCASEVRIRQILGDSPDTSKALRMFALSLPPPPLLGLIEASS